MNPYDAAYYARRRELLDALACEGASVSALASMLGWQSAEVTAKLRSLLSDGIVGCTVGCDDAIWFTIVSRTPLRSGRDVTLPGDCA